MGELPAPVLSVSVLPECSSSLQPPNLQHWDHRVSSASSGTGNPEMSDVVSLGCGIGVQESPALIPGASDLPFIPPAEIREKAGLSPGWVPRNPGHSSGTAEHSWDSGVQHLFPIMLTG